MVETEEIAFLLKVPRMHHDLAMRLNEELKLGYKSVGAIAASAIREYALTWLRGRIPKWFNQKEYQVLQGAAAKSRLSVEQLLLEIYSLPEAELKRLLPLGFKK